MTTTAETFSQNFRTSLVALSRTSPDTTLVDESNSSTAWQRMESSTMLIQFRVWTERFVGPTAFAATGDSRIRVLRLVMDFWNRLADTESEEDVIGATGQMQDDFDLWGSPEYWRDVYTSDPALDYAIQRLDDSEPVFTAENLGGVLMHYSISVGLLAVP